MSGKESEPREDQARKIGEDQKDLNQKGEMPRKPDGDAGMDDQEDVERAKRGN